MRKLIRRQYGRERGFTMLELLIVIIILGILAAVLVPRLMSLRSSGDVAAANTEVGNVESGAIAYLANTTNYQFPTNPFYASSLYNSTGYSYISAVPKYFNYPLDVDGKVVVAEGAHDVVGAGLAWNLTGHKWIKQ